MATLSEIVTNAQNLLKAGRQSDDNDFSDRQMAFIVNYYRSKLIKERLQKGRKVDPNSVQNLGKVPLTKADADECCYINNCVLRTEEKLPEIHSHNGNRLVTYIGEIGGDNPYQRTTYQGVKWTSYRPYTSKMPKWYIDNSYLYIVNPPTQRLSYINVRAVFTDPTKANEFRSCMCDNDQECYEGLGYEYPMSLHDLDVIYKLMMQTELKVLLSTRQDVSNDSIDKGEYMIQPQTSARK